ncbi:hypothetical protein MRX96_036981 [Rhipicephalus microplus]
MRPEWGKEAREGDTSACRLAPEIRRRRTRSSVSGGRADRLRPPEFDIFVRPAESLPYAPPPPLPLIPSQPGARADIRIPGELACAPPRERTAGGFPASPRSSLGCEH